jgi:hypothetical protein
MKYKLGTVLGGGQKKENFLFSTQEMGVKTQNVGPHLLVLY